MTSPFPIERVRAQFPSLALSDGGKPRVYLDNPAGTQVPRQVIDRVNAAFVNTNANLGGFFTTSVMAGELVDEAHRAMADLYGAASPEEIVFGQSMTALTLQISRGLARQLRPGDEIVLSRMDHDGNVAPWLLIAEDLGLTVRWIDFDPGTYEFPDDALDRVLSERTRIVAFGYASNCTGTINDVKSLAAKAKSVGAIVYVDAVQFAPHGAIDVQALGCDFLVSSAYKFFGPHQGVLWGRREMLESTFSYQVRPARDVVPGKFELGTSPRELLAGTIGAVEYVASLGDTGGGRRQGIVSGMAAMQAWEQSLAGRLIAGLRTFKGVTIRGITSANALHRRVPTVSFTHDGKSPQEIAQALARDNIFVWSGHNYALEPVRRMGLLDKGGVLRIGMAHYNTPQEVDALLASLDRTLAA